MIKYNVRELLKVEAEKEDVKNICEHYLYVQTDIGNLLAECVDLTIFDTLLYGYSPWDYSEEIKMCLIKQGFIGGKDV